MSEAVEKQTDEQIAREVAEEARETEWLHPSFVSQLFLGKFRPDLIFPFPEQDEKDKAEGDAFMEKIEAFLLENLDPDEVDLTGEMPEAVLKGLQEVGAFSMKLPKDYGGLGMSQTNYNRVAALISTFCASTIVYLSAHQSIGVPTPLKMFGTKEQKDKYMEKLCTEWISAFALTEPMVGSDPARMQTTGVLDDDGEHYILNGEKLWCTNGTITDFMIVMAQTDVPGQTSTKKRISAFMVRGEAEGVDRSQRCQFVGLRGIANGLVTLKNVKVHKDDMLGKPGEGLKIALTTLNTGRLTLPACCCGSLRRALQIAREWAKVREQWGAAIGKHESVANMLSGVAADLFGMEAMVWFASAMIDRGNYDIRLEAAMAKLFCSERGWQAMDDVFQIRGGRAYETAQSLKDRGSAPVPTERLFRDFRINRIVEGTSQIMHLFLAREALDPHMKIAGKMIDPKASGMEKFSAFIKASFKYAFWLPGKYIGWGCWPRFGEYGPLATHVRFIERNSRKMARRTFWKMARYQAKLEKKQVLIGRVVEIGTELFAMSAACSRAVAMEKKNPNGKAYKLADLFCRRARRRIADYFAGMNCNDDDAHYKVAREVLEDSHTWLEYEMVATEEMNFAAGWETEE